MSRGHSAGARQTVLRAAFSCASAGLLETPEGSGWTICRDTAPLHRWIGPLLAVRYQGDQGNQISFDSMMWILAAFWLVGAQAQLQDLPTGLSAFLHEAMGLDSAQIQAVRRGDAVVTVLDTELQRDIAVFGIAAVALSRDEYVRRVLDFGDSAASPTRRSFGVFSHPPTPADVRDVTIHQRDVDEMKDCRPGACAMKLPATDMSRLRQEIDWSASDAQARLSAYARERLLEYVADYRARGDAASVTYDDRGSVRASEAFADLLAATPQVYRYVPALHRYLTGYPAVTLPQATEVLFWSEDVSPRLRPVLSVTHLVVYAPPEYPDVTLVAAKQIYANHYFEAAFDLTCFVEATADGGGRGYLVVLRRYRFDRLASGGPLDLRGRALTAFREQLLADLQRQQRAGDPGSPDR